MEKVKKILYCEFTLESRSDSTGAVSLKMVKNCQGNQLMNCAISKMLNILTTCIKKITRSLLYDNNSYIFHLTWLLDLAVRELSES